MNRKKFIICTIILICILITSFFIYQRLDNIQTHSSELLSHIQEVYTPTYQNQIKDNINVMKNKSYTLNDPLILENPFQTNTTSLYVYFYTKEPAVISYQVHVDGLEDFSRELYGDYTTEHEYQLIGIVPNQKNILTLTATNQDGDIIASHQWTYDAPALLSGHENAYVSIEKGNSTQQLSNGLYTILGNDTSENDDDIDYIFLYDNNGVIRSEIPIISYRAHRLLFDDDTMYYSVSSSLLAGMNRLGQITQFYDTGHYRLHHDYINGSNNDFLVLATQSNTDTEEDKIISIDKETHEIKKVIDLEELFINYRQNLDSSQDEALDWMHINALQLVDKDSLIISSRETSTIIKINSIYDSPTVDYMIGSPLFWQESGYDEFLLTQIGDFSLNAGQHCVTYQQDDKLADGQYYLYFYNNNNTISTTRDYDYKNDPYYYDTGEGNKGKQSYYYKYLIDENERTFELVESIPVTYSGYVSSVQEHENHKIIDSGSAFETVELDDQNNIIQTIKGTGDTWWYRVFKYTYNHFWFQDEN